MNKILLLSVLLVTAFMLLGCAARSTAPSALPAVPNLTPSPASNSSPISPAPNFPLSTPSVMPIPAPSVNFQPLKAQYAPGEVTRRCDAAITKLNTTLNEIASRPIGQRQTALLDFETSMADYSDEINPLYFTGYVYPDANISAEGSACEMKMGQFGSEITTRKDIYNSVKEFTPKTDAQKRLYNRTITSFELNGLALPDERLAAVRELKKNLSALTSRFSQNLNLDNKTIVFTPAELEGVPADTLERLARTADGNYIVTMKYPDYYGVMENANISQTRLKMSVAFTNRGSPQENTRLLQEAILVREQLAAELGFATWADFQTRMRMAKNASNVQSFITGLEPGLANRSREDIASLLVFKKTLEPNATRVYPWDGLYLENQLKKSAYALDNEKVREYLPLDTVLPGMFSIYSHLFNVSFQPVAGAKVWAPDVQLYRVADMASNATMAYIYFDLFPREGKYGHEAMFPLVLGRAHNGTYEIPITAIVANNNPPTASKPSLMTHDEVVGLFHEFGHALHSSFSRVPYASLSGTSVAWDFVETPSQTLENWAWDSQVMDNISGYYLNHSQKMPPAMRDTIIRTRDLDQGYAYASRLAQTQVDMDYHTALGPVDVIAVYNADVENITGMTTTPGNSFPATFGHIMGGYDAGYYSYMWSESYALDIFSALQTDGLDNQTTGLRLRNDVLSQGDLKDGDVLLGNFLGRAPNSNAYLQRLNITYAG